MLHSQSPPLSSPFPRHVLRFLYAGKSITLVDHRGAQLDFQADRYRSILSDIEDKFRREHFSCAQLSSPSSPKPIRKLRRTPTAFFAVAPLQASPDLKESIELTVEESESEQVTVSGPLQPSSQLLHFLRQSDSPCKPSRPTAYKSGSWSSLGSPKSQSPEASPVLSRKLKGKRVIPRFPKPTISRRCLGVGQDRRLGLAFTPTEPRKPRSLRPSDGLL